jgi:DUF2075 family protein
MGSPNELRDLILERNQIDNKSRMVAGYCWDWKSKKNSQAMDIVFPEHQFGMQWNLTEDGAAWIIRPESVQQIGCIHTCQGLEVDYVGVIVGGDLVIENGKLGTDPKGRAKSDKSLNGYIGERKLDPEAADAKADELIRNTYRTLMSRGMKGCYVYFTDPAVKKYFEDRIPN